MTWTPRRPRIALIAAALVAALTMVLATSTSPADVHAATITVNSTADGPDIAPGNGVCQTATAGQCTLRAAIQEANALAGTDTIGFSLGAGTPTISPLSQLPTISTALTITGGAAKVELNGASAGATSVGLFIAGPGPVTIIDMVINRFNNDGIQIAASGTVEIYETWIGTDPTGLIDLGNADDGIHATSGTIIVGDSGLGNVIAGNAGHGIVATPGATSLTVRGNYIGVDANGTGALGNGNSGVTTNVPAAIGGVTAGYGNVISSNATAGISVVGAGATGVVIQGNAIGVNEAGTADLGNGADGVRVLSSGSATIGGSTVAARNVISGNTENGIEIASTSGPNDVDGNYIGVGANGTTAIGNSINGIVITGSGNDIGLAAPNLIAHNTGDGIAISTGNTNRAQGNSIHSNGNLGIDLNNNGVTANDANDADGGGNDLQNYPVLTSATVGGGTTSIAGSFNSLASTTFRIDYYNSPSCDVSGNGEGATHLGNSFVTTNASGNATIAASMPAVTGGSVVTTTATSATPLHNTSEFSACQVATCAAPDTDCDGFNDVAPTSHTGPANTNTAFDNCIGVSNPAQTNSDGNFINLPASKAYDDLTHPNSDALGDACDTDDDNDARSDFAETAPCPLSGATSFTLGDSDGDRALDGPECAIGTNPASAGSTPTAAQCVTASGAASTATDSDLDSVKDYVEYCYYNTSNSSANTDGDTCSDAKEIASINADTTVNSTDLGQVAQAFGASTTPQYVTDFDTNKDGTINSSDLSFVAQRFGPC